MKSRFELFQTKLGKSDRDMALRCGVTRQQVNYWKIYGVRRWEVAERLARRLNTTPETLIGTIKGI